MAIAVAPEPDERESKVVRVILVVLLAVVIGLFIFSIVDAYT